MATDLSLWDTTHPLGPCPFRDYVSQEIDIRRGLVGGVDTVMLDWSRRGVHTMFAAAFMDGLSQRDIELRLLEPAGRALHDMRRKGERNNEG